MKLKKIASLLLISPLLIGTLQAVPCSSVEFFSQFGLEADALYWKASRDNRDFAVTRTTTPTQEDTYSAVEPKNHWGWRLKTYFQENPYSLFFADLEYTHYTAQETASTINPSFYTYFNPSVLSQIDAHVKEWYRKLRGRVGYFIQQTNLIDFYVFGGGDWIYLKEQNALKAFPIGGNTLSMEQFGKFNGGALEAGLGMKVHLFSHFFLKGEMAAMGLLGPRSYGQQFSTPIPPPLNSFTINYPSQTVCLPGLDVSVEANYTFCTWVPLCIAVGYEHHQYFNMLLLSPLYDTDGYSTPVLNDRGFGGAYFALRCNF